LAEFILVVGLVSRAAFDRRVGVESIYQKTFIPLINGLFSLAMNSQQVEDNNTLLENLLKTLNIII